VDRAGILLGNLINGEVRHIDVRAEARLEGSTDAMPDSQEAEMSLPFIGYTYKAFNAFQTS
jgi:hypothetical protein